MLTFADLLAKAACAQRTHYRADSHHPNQRSQYQRLASPNKSTDIQNNTITSLTQQPTFLAKAGSSIVELVKLSLRRHVSQPG